MGTKNKLEKASAIVTAGIGRDCTEGYFGCVEGLHDTDAITGWAVNAANEREMLSIGLYADGELLATAYCTDARADIIALHGKIVRSGFTLPVGLINIPERLMGAGAEIEVEFRIENTKFVLPVIERDFLDIATLSKRIKSVSRSNSEAVICKDVAKYVEELALPPEEEPKIKAIAFYLPQYHPIPENDEWWGPGFTEWTNVSQAKPAFRSHYQPRIPGELGFYDLRLPEVREAQAKLAREHGIHGFCYYYYWFGGRRILERPLDEMLQSGKPDFPFCICWANETWSRRWDGSENEVLLKQEHTPSNDIAFIRDVIPMLKDPRYIKVGGAPLLMIYRTSLFPNMKSTAEVWRKICAAEGIPRIHLCAVESFGFNDPYSIGFDSSVQFPPHGISASEIKDTISDLDEDFQGHVYDYEEVVEHELVAIQPAYKRFRGVMLSWDNTARRKKMAHMFHNASPRAYEVWLRGAVDWTQSHLPPGEQLVFINAWNEWAEGTHLEPDVKNGRAYLEATERALRGQSEWPVLVDYARAKGLLEGEELQGWLAELEARFEKADRIEKHAKRLISRSQAIGSSGTIMSQTPPYVVELLPVLNTAEVHFERVNAFVGNLEVLHARRKEPMYVEGWCVHPTTDVTVATVSYLVMESLKEKTRFYAPIYGRHPREDVLLALEAHAASKTRYSGFRAYVDIEQLEYGEYRLGLIEVAKDSIAINYLDGVVRVV